MTRLPNQSGNWPFNQHIQENKYFSVLLPIISATLKYMYSIVYSSHAVTIVSDKLIFEFFKRSLPQVLELKTYIGSF